MTKIIAKETLVSTFKPIVGDDGREIKRLEDLPHKLIVREGVRDAGTEAPPHHHEWGQMLYAAKGVMQVMAQGSIWVIPPQRAVWIPPRVRHSIRIVHSATMQNIYIAPAHAGELPAHCQVMTITPLLRELIDKAANFPPLYDEDGAEGRLVDVLMDCLHEAPTAALHLPIPERGPLKTIADHIKAAPNDASTLEDWADKLGTTSRTLARHFQKETNMTFGQWRQQARLLEALTRLANNQPVAHIAQDLGYSTQSAFSAMFKKALGTSPAQFFKDK